MRRGADQPGKESTSADHHSPVASLYEAHDRSLGLSITNKQLNRHDASTRQRDFQNGEVASEKMYSLKSVLPRTNKWDGTQRRVFERKTV